MFIDKKIVRDMLAEIVSRHPLQPSWSWAIIDNLAPIESVALFSEDETYGYYVKTNHPSSIAFRNLPWLRSGASHTGTLPPTLGLLQRLAETYCFAAFESWQLPGSRRGIRSRLRRLLRSLPFIREGRSTKWRGDTKPSDS